jgi:hypothetical protein
MNFLTIGLLFILVNSVSAVRPPPAGMTYDLQYLYEVDFGTDDEGGCQSHEEQIKAAYGEALDLLQGAEDSLNDLQQPIPATGDSAAANEWRRKADTFFTLFGRKLTGKGWKFGSEKMTPDWIASQVWRKSPLYRYLDCTKLHISSQTTK